MDEGWKGSLSRSEVGIEERRAPMDLSLLLRTLILTEGNIYRLKLKSLSMKDGGDISFQCGDVKDSCKITVKECTSFDQRWCD